MSEVVILGAGLSGLGCARTLGRCRVFEAQPHPGGQAFSHECDETWFDQGAHISHTKNQEFLNLIYSSAGSVHQISRSLVSNFWKGRKLTYPVQNNLHELPLENRAQALADLIMAHLERREPPPENYERWCRSQYGDYLTDHFYDVFTRKYWRVEMRDLATDWLGGRLIPSLIPRIIEGAFVAAEEKQTAFARFHYPAKGGFFGFFRSLYESLDVEYNQRAVEIDLPARRIVFESGKATDFEFLASSIPLPELVRILTDAPSSVREASTLLRHTKLLCVNILVENPTLIENHWCYVYDHEVPPSRISFPGNLAPGSVPEGTTAIQAEVFRRADEAWDVDALAESTTERLGALLGFDPRTDVRSVTPLVVPRAYVISDHARKRAVSHILDWLADKRVFPMGLYGKWEYIWSDVAYGSGVESARKIQESLCQKP